MAGFNKPQGYDEAQAMGEFTPLKPGGHKLVILGAKRELLKDRYEVIRVQFDTAKDDVQPNYFRNSFATDTRENKKYNGEYNVFTETKEYNGVKRNALKNFHTAVEHSNKDFKVQWGENYFKQFKDKVVGGVFREEEYLDGQGNKKTSVRLMLFRSADKINDVEVPKKKTLEPEPPIAPVDADGFMTIPDSLDEELPFV